MKKIFFLFLIGIFSCPIIATLGQNEKKVEVILPQGTNKIGEYESIFYPHQKLTQMSAKKEKVLLKLHSIPVKSKLEELKKLSKEKYYEMLWDLPIPVPQNYDKNDSALLDEVVVYRGPEPPERTKSNVLQIDIEILALKYKEADEASKQIIKNKLNEYLTEYFQLRSTGINNRVKDAEEKLNQLKQELTSVTQNKEKIVTRRLKELIGEKK